MKREKEWVEVKIHKTGKYPKLCTQIKFEMIADGSQWDAVAMLMAYLDLGRYSFVDRKKED